MALRKCGRSLANHSHQGVGSRGEACRPAGQHAALDGASRRGGTGKRAKIIHAAGELEASDKLPLPIELLELLKAKLDTNPQAKSER